MESGTNHALWISQGWVYSTVPVHFPSTISWTNLPVNTPSLKFARDSAATFGNIVHSCTAQSDRQSIDSAVSSILDDIPKSRVTSPAVDRSKPPMMAVLPPHQPPPTGSMPLTQFLPDRRPVMCLGCSCDHKVWAVGLNHNKSLMGLWGCNKGVRDCLYVCAQRAKEQRHNVSANASECAGVWNVIEVLVMIGLNEWKSAESSCIQPDKRARGVNR